MPRQPKPIAKWSQYLAARLAAMAITAFDPDVNLRTAALLGRLLHRFDHRHRERGLAHLHMAFAELSQDQVQSLNVRAFEHFMQLAVEVLHTPRLITPDSWTRYARLGYLGRAIELFNANKPIITLTGHVGNWEMVGTLMTVLGYPVSAVARPIDNPLINDWLLGLRTRRGMDIITKWQATGRMTQVLRRGGALGFIADQNAGAKGLFVPFFGKLASTYKSIGLLAMSMNVPIICGGAVRVGQRFFYEINLTDVILPQDWARRRDPLYYITARYMRAIEMVVRMAPAQYLWMHRRWKTRPRYELQGKPMPTALRRNLDDLPWMDQATMDQLMQPVTAPQASPV